MLERFKLLKVAEKQFFNYYEKENDFRRLAILYSIGAFIVSPIFCLFSYNSDLLKVYFNICLSFSIFFPIYILICWKIKEIKNYLLYFFHGHFLIATYFAVEDLVNFKFSQSHFFYFFLLFAIIAHLIQRLNLTFIYILFTYFFLLYGFSLVDEPELTLVNVTIILFVFSSTIFLVLFSRVRLINNVQDYSDYLKKIVNKPGSGFILFKIKNSNTIDIIDYNQKTNIFFQIDNKDETERTRKFIEFFTEDEFVVISKIEGEEVFRKQVELIIENKTKTFELKTGLLVLKSGKYWLCRLEDITENVQHELELSNREKKYRNLYYKNQAGVFTLNNQSYLLDCNEAFHIIFENDIQKEEQFFNTSDQKSWNRLFIYLKEHETLRNEKFEFTLKSGKKKTLIFNWYYDKINQHIEGTVIDITKVENASKAILRAEIAEEGNKLLKAEITERIKTEKLLQDQYLRNKAIFDSSANTLLLIFNMENKISSFNKHSETYFNHLTGEILHSGQNFNLIFNKLFNPKELRYFQILLNKVKNGLSERIEAKYIYEGKKKWLELFINPIFDTEGNVYEISLVAHDISNKKKNEKAIVSSLQEKEILLKEIHHRVKNNLQIISSILNLQSSFVHDPKILDILQDSRNRIRSMAMIHESLYRTTNFSSINFSNYIQNISSNLLASFRINEALISFSTDLSSVDLILDQAIPCGLMVNELITNTIKYAFPENRKGEIKIKLQEIENIIYLTVQDNGIGLPEDFNIENLESLGLQLVVSLTEQLNGNIEIIKSNGTKFLITFEKAKQ